MRSESRSKPGENDRYLPVLSNPLRDPALVRVDPDLIGRRSSRQRSMASPPTTPPMSPRLVATAGPSVSADVPELVSKGLAVTLTPPTTLSSMSVLEQVQGDVRTAMKARDRERAAALRMVVDVLQQDAKLGKGDEVAVLQQGAQEAGRGGRGLRGAGRAEQAAAERFEAS